VKRWPLLLPFLFAVAPVLALYAHNIGQAALWETLLPIGCMLVLTLLLFPLGVWAFRSAVRAAVALSLLWWVVFAYGHVGVLIGRASIAGHGLADPRLLLSATSLLLFACGVSIRRARSEPVLLARVLLIVVVSMLGTSLITVARVSAGREPFDPASVIPAEAFETGVVARKPDVYYIIFDRFGSNITLNARYHYNAAPLIEYLRGRGFFVADDSRANYLVTAQSLASSLNMAHLLPLSDVVGRASSNWLPVFELLEDNRLQRFLSDQGYRYIHIGPNWRPTAMSRFADVNVRFAKVPEFTSLLISTTAFYPILYRLNINNPSREKYQRVQYQLDLLEQLPAREPEPMFVFAHFLVPHGPYVFNRDGTFRDPDTAETRDEVENFSEQVQWVDGRIRTLVDGLLNAYPPDQPPVIVIQGDEGPYPARTQPHSFDWRTATDTELSDKMRILNAIYAPACQDRFYASMTPVNTFRILLNGYFATRLDMLPDRSYAYRDLAHLYDFTDVTDRVSVVRD
jgi:hypothetical protein